jgi:hypothetical protein
MSFDDKRYKPTLTALMRRHLLKIGSKFDLKSHSPQLMVSVAETGFREADTAASERPVEEACNVRYPP